MKTATWILTAVLIAGTADTAVADVIHLTNGAQLEGDAERTDAGRWIVRIGTGHLVLDAASVERVDEGAAKEDGTPRPAISGRTIDTTHRIELAAGGSVRGNVVDTDAEDRVRIEYGNWGFIELPRSQVAEIAEDSGVVHLGAEPATPTPSAHREAPADTEGAGTDRTVRPGVYDPAAETAITVEDFRRGMLSLVDRYPELNPTPDAAEQVRYYTYQLTRDDTNYRVRAETHLRALGPVSIPELRPLASHPFDLTRRATLRLIRDYGHEAGIPIAIAALTDRDSFVRQHALEALDRIIGISERDELDRDASTRRFRDLQNRYWSAWRVIWNAYPGEAETPSR